MKIKFNKDSVTISKVIEAIDNENDINDDFEYMIIEKIDMLDSLKDWMKEATNDFDIMLENYIEIKNFKGEYLLSSKLTNYYIDIIKENEDEINYIIKDLKELLKNNKGKYEQQKK